MALRIVIDARHVRDFGIGTYIRNLVRALAKIDQENRYFLAAFTADVSYFNNLPPNFSTSVYDRPDTQERDNLSFPLFLRNFSADLFHIPLDRVPLWMPRPYVVTVHDMSRLFYNRRGGIRNQLSLYRARRGLQRAEVVIAVSQATQRDVRNFFGIPSSRIRQIYNAPDPRFLVPPSAPGEAHNGETRQRILDRYQIHYPFVLYAGSIRPQKNVPRLVEAFAVLRGELENHPQYKNLRLIIIGDEISQNPAVRLAVIRSRVEQTVRFLGFVPIETLRTFYQSASLFAFPSLYEGFGLPPLEAMACGTPVVASNVSSLPEVVGEAAVGVNPDNVFDIARGLREALLDEDLRARLIARGFNQVKRFSWEQTAAEVLSIYKEAAR